MGRELGESKSKVGSNITRAGLVPSKHDTFKILDIKNQYLSVPYYDRAYGRIQRFTPLHHMTKDRKTYDDQSVFFSVALRPNASHGLLILEISRSHTTTHHSR